MNVGDSGPTSGESVSVFLSPSLLVPLRADAEWVSLLLSPTGRSRSRYVERETHVSNERPKILASLRSLGYGYAQYF